MITNVNQCVKSFMDEYNVTKLTRDEIEKIIECMGYKIILFHPKQKNTAIAKLIDRIGVGDDIKIRQSFAYHSGSTKCVFIDESIGEPDSIQLLLHEIGHIYMGHTSSRQDDAATIAKNENDANRFALLVIQRIAQTERKQKILKYARSILITGASMALFICLIRVDYRSNHGSTAQETNVVVLKSESTTESATTKPAATEPVQTETAAEQAQDDTEIYYITKSGQKYHRQTCSTIKNRNPDTLVAGTREEFESSGYEPCMICIGE